MTRVIVVALAFLSVFFFPYPATIALSFAASLFLPVAGLLAGVLTDVLYHAPGASFLPVASFIGAAVSLAAFFVRRVVKARIIGG